MQRKSIMAEPACPVLNKKSINLLTDICFWKETKKSGDLVFVFGTTTQQTEAVKKVIQLIKMFPKIHTIILTGLCPFNTKMGTWYTPESLAMKNIFCKLMKEKEIYIGKNWAIQEFKIGKRTVYCETESTNSCENIKNTLNILKKIKHKGITTLNKPYSVWRAKCYFNKLLPKEEIYQYWFKVHLDQKNPITRKNWHANETFKKRVRWEMLRMVEYEKIKSLVIDNEVKRKIERLKKIVKI